MKTFLKICSIVVLAMVVITITSCDLVTDIEQSMCEHEMEAHAEVAPTCTETGLSAGVVCSKCGYEQRRRFEIPATGHKMADATCELPSTCKNCDYTEGEALGHDMQPVDATAPTCTAVGYTAHTACSRCDHVEGKDEVAMIEHSYTIAVEALAPACEVNGYTAHNACECGAVDENYEVIPALEHDFDEEALFYYPSAPTCTEGAYIAGYCVHCGEGFLLQEVAPLGHSWEDSTCTVCGAEKDAAAE